MLSSNRRTDRWVSSAIAIAASLICAAAPAQAEDIQGSAPGIDDLSAFRPACILGVSKDLCNGSLSGGVAQVVGCTTPTGPCRTLIVRGAQLRVDVDSNPDACPDPFGTVPGQCDEADLDGLLTMYMNFKLRLDNPCLGRGCWDARFNISRTTPTGPSLLIADGSGYGTLGTGSHRGLGNPCLVPFGVSCGRDCESCYDVSYDPLSGLWRVGFEGALRGKVRGGDDRNATVCVTISGDFYAAGTFAGPSDSAGGWLFCGTADGVIEKPCAFTDVDPTEIDP